MWVKLHQLTANIDQLAAISATRETTLLPVGLGGSSSSNANMAVSGNEPPTVEGADSAMVDDDAIELEP